MAVQLDKLVDSISHSGLMSADEIDAFINGLPPEKRPGDAKQLVQEMVRRKKLTKFQAQAVYLGKSRGLVMGNYVVLDKLGEGGMGQVYKARHRRMDRIVALKVLPAAAMKEADAVQRFQQEVKAAARLTHPNIVRAYDADEAGGMHFLVMEYVEGIDLGSLDLEKTRIPVRVAVDYVVQAARGLEYAHSKNIIHRDVKPSNLLLESDGTIKVLDMGLARFNEQANPDDETAAEGLTQSGQVMGTLDYMSPEQAQRTKAADERSDIYSLGCTLFYLLTGRPIYEGDTLVAKIVAHRDQPIPSLRAIRNDVPKPLDTAFQKMVAKNPQLRHQTMTRVIAALQNFGSGGAPGGGKPAVHSQAATGTVSTPRSTIAASPAPPAPSEALPPALRRKDALRQAKEMQRRQSFKSELEKTVKAADRQHRRALGKDPITMLKKLFGRVMGPVIALAFLAAVVTGGYVGYNAWSLNSRLIDQSQERILAVVNQMLPQARLEPITAITFTNATRFGSMPETLSFQEPLFGETNVGRRRGGTLIGQFDRAKGEIKADIEVYNGNNAEGLVFKVKPVP
jgi:serine/threonine protein kinase